MDQFITVVLTLTHRGVTRDIAHIIAAWALGVDAFADAINTGHLGYVMAVRRALNCGISHEHIEMAVKNGSIKVSIWALMRNPSIDLVPLFISACSRSHLVLAQWLNSQLTEKEPIVGYQALTAICIAPQWCPELADMILHEYGKFGLWNALQCVCCAGRLSALKWLVRCYGINIDDIRRNFCYSLRMACLYGHLDMAQWIVSEFGLNLNNEIASYLQALVGACENNHLHIVQWLMVDCIVPNHKAIYVAKESAKRKSHQPLTRWLNAEFPDI